MKFIDLSDATRLMRIITEAMDTEDPFYADFRFFSAVNYTTQSEKKFLEEFVIENRIFVEGQFIEDLKALYCWL